MTEHPDNIRVVVVGGPGKHSSLIPSWGMTRSVTVPVEGMTVRIYRPDGDVDAPTTRARRPPVGDLARLSHRGARQRQAERRRR